MALVTAPVAVAAPARPQLLRPGWAIAAYFVLFPLWWVLGVAPFAGPLLAVPMLLWLARQSRVAVPPYFGLWALFLVWMLLSATQLDAAFRLLPFLYRAGLYLSATVFFLVIYNLPSGALAARRVIGFLAVLWLWTVLGGLAGLLAPDFEFTSVLERVLPASILSNNFVQELVHPRLAQVATFLGYDQPRPVAPYVYTNEWGSSLALLTPAYLAWLLRARGLWRTGGLVLLGVAVVPAIASLNRGLWVSAGVALVYAAIRLAFRGRTGALKAVLALFAFIAALYALTPLQGIVQDRLETGHSNASRSEVYSEAAEGAAEAPILGYGSTREQEDETGRRIGTHGHLWLVLFSHGIPGLVFFTGWFVSTVLRTWRVRDPALFFLHVSLVAALVQMPFYSLVPTQLHIMMAAAAVVLRERQRVGVPAPATVGASR